MTIKDKAITIKGTDITLKELHARLNERLISDQNYPREYSLPISLTGLSELLATGDIGEQLKAGGRGNLRAIPIETVDTLANFLPFFRMTKAKRPLAPFFLRIFLHCKENEIALPTSEEEWEIGRITKDIALEIGRLVPFTSDEVRRKDDIASVAFKVLTIDDVRELINAPMVEEVEELCIYIGTEKRWRRADIVEYINTLPTKKELAEAASQKP